jgi:hypothetical protein
LGGNDLATASYLALESIALFGYLTLLEAETCPDTIEE